MLSVLCCLCSVSSGFVSSLSVLFGSTVSVLGLSVLALSVLFQFSVVSTLSVLCLQVLFQLSDVSTLSVLGLLVLLQLSVVNNSKLISKFLSSLSSVLCQFKIC